jgi:MFS family permease
MRYFRFLVVGYTVSSYGSFLNLVALNLFAYHVTGSALGTGVLMALRLAASFACGLVAGGVVSRFNRKFVMVTADLTQAAALTALALLPGGARPSALYGVAVLAGTCATLSGVALRSSVPEIVGQDRRVRANGLLVTGRSLAMVGGFASAGLVISVLGYQAAFLLDAATFVFSALNLARLPIATRGGEQPPTAAGEAPGLLTAQVAALRFLRLEPVLHTMIIIRGADGFGSASHNVAMPVYSSAVDPVHPAALMGQFWATWAIGNILAQQAVGRYTRKRGRSVGERAFAVGVCLMSVSFILVFAGLPAGLGIVVAMVAGMADGFTEIAYTSRLQAVPDPARGYVFGFSATVENFGFGLGMVISAALLDHVAPLRVVGTLHGLAVVLALAFLVVLFRNGRGAAHRRSAVGGLPQPDQRTPQDIGVERP